MAFRGTSISRVWCACGWAGVSRTPLGSSPAAVFDVRRSGDPSRRSPTTSPESLGVLFSPDRYTIEAVTSHAVNGEGGRVFTESVAVRMHAAGQGAGIAGST